MFFLYTHTTFVRDCLVVRLYVYTAPFTISSHGDHGCDVCNTWHVSQDTCIDL